MNRRMRAMIVPEGTFPFGRVAECCNKRVKPGESVLVVNTFTGKLTIRIVLHRGCLSEAMQEMPLERKEVGVAFAKMRADIQRTGNLFPGEGDTDGGNGLKRKQPARI